MIGLRNAGMPIARSLMECGFKIGGHWRHGSPELASAGSIHDRVPGMSALDPGEPS